MVMSSMALPRLSRAAIFRGPDRSLELITTPIPDVLDEQILVQVLCCTICGSDLHTYQGRRSTAGPTILGHEITGRVVEDRRPGGVAPGARVTWTLCDSCGKCFFCRRGIPQKCTELRKYGHEADTEWPLSGGLADYCLLRRGTSVLRVPEGLPDVTACPANCATATVAAALRVAGDCSGRTVLILGAGMLGLTAAAMAKVRGAQHVIVVDTHAARAAQARRFGATAAVHLTGEDRSEVSALVRHVTDDRGVDLVLEMSGAPSSVEAAPSYCRIGGCLVLVGSVFPARPVSWNAEQIVRRLLRIEGVHNYTPGDLAEALRFLAAAHRRYPFEQLVTRTFRLDEVASAFAYAIDSGDVRVAVVP
jgi:alcohol dehydrogenase